MSHLPNHATSTPGAPSSTEDDVPAPEGAPDTEAPASPTILVVDDTEGNRYAVSHILRGAGMHVIEADNGRDALRLMESAPDLVVLDIRLPDITGYELCRRIKTNPATAFTPVMHVSASYTADADRAYGLEAGADAYLTHPVEPELLLATTRALLRASRAEAGFRRAAREWRTTFDAISDPIFLIDGRGVVRRCNRAAAELAHRSPKELIGHTWDEVRADIGLAHHPELSRIAHGPPIRNVEVLLGDRCFNVSTDQAESESGADVLVVCVWSDVTAREAANRERDALLERTERALHETELARLEAESANRAKSDFLAVMSHELRTPLNAIAGFTELIMLGIRGPVTQEQAVDLEKIRRSQVTLLALINDVLSFAKIESSSVHYDIQDIVVDDALAAAAEFVEVQLRTKGVRFVHDRCAPGIIVRADPDKLQQILLNLLSNAVKFTPSAGTVTLSCECDGDHVLLRVSDTGHGIAEDRWEAIFDPFVQVDQRLVREHHGVGLGLAISRNLARGMGGDLSVASVVGEGSTFTLRLPTP
jgi:PAS domain S-box-containing protein